MLIDMHAHTAGISRCCLAGAEDVLRAAQAAGIDGLVLCNHYQEAYVTDAGAAAFAERYIEEYLLAEKIAAEMGVRLFFGVEITAKKYGNAHILVYGASPDFVRQHPEVYDYTLEEIGAAVHPFGGLVVHAHPFRNGGRLLDTALLDGIEVNCHPLYDATHCDEILSIAANEGLLVTCGGDYHADAYRAVCGTYFPDDVADSAGLAACLKNASEIRLHVHELRTDFHRDVTFIKRK